MLTRQLLRRSVLKINPTMALTQATLETRSAEADKIIETLTKNIEAIKAMGTLPSNIQETILKQENSQLRYLKGSKIHHVQNLTSNMPPYSKSKNSHSENKSKHSKQN